MFDFFVLRFGCFLCCFSVGKTAYCHVMSEGVRKGEVTCNWSVLKFIFVPFFNIKIFGR